MKHGKLSEQKYSNKSSASRFKEYLKEISAAEDPDIWKIPENKMEAIQQSNLFAKYDAIFPDSVWFDGKLINVSYSAMEIVTSGAIGLKEDQYTDPDSLVLYYKQMPRLQEKEPSHFIIALEAIASEDTLICNYLKAKKTAGTLSIRLIADGLRLSCNEQNEYFAKRIILMEMND